MHVGLYVDLHVPSTAFFRESGYYMFQIFIVHMSVYLLSHACTYTEPRFARARARGAVVYTMIEKRRE